MFFLAVGQWLSIVEYAFMASIKAMFGKAQ